MPGSQHSNESTLIVCALSVKVLMERFAVISHSPAAIRTIEWRIDVTQCGREISYSQRKRLTCTRPWRRVTSRVLSPCRREVLLFVLHFNSAPATLATWTRGETRFTISPPPLFLSLFVSCFHLSFSFSPSSSLPHSRALSLFLSSACPTRTVGGPSGLEETQAARGEHVPQEQRQYWHILGANRQMRFALLELTQYNGHFYDGFCNLDRASIAFI